MNSFFDGEFKVKPTQNLKSNLLTREQLLQRNQEERQKRERLRKQNKASITIQQCFKTYVLKKKLYRQLQIDLRTNLVYLANLKQPNELDLNLFHRTTRDFLFCYNSRTDSESLSILSHFFIKHKQLICDLIEQAIVSPIDGAKVYHQTNQWLYRLKRLILLNLEGLFKLMSDDSENAKQSNNFVQLRLLDVFTSMDFYAKNFKSQSNVIDLCKSIWNYLIKNNYFLYMRKIMEIKIPAPYATTVAYTPMERSIYELTIRPLNVQYSEQDRSIVKQVIIQFFRQYLSGPFSQIIRFHVFSLINERIPRLLNLNFLCAALEQSENLNEIILPSNVWTLYALLSISSSQIEQASPNERLVYLRTIQNLIQHLPNQSKHNELDDLDEEDEPMQEETCDQLQREAVNLIAKESIALLNLQTNVNSLIGLLKCSNEKMIQDCFLSFSSIGYSILINNKTSVYENRFLYTLAFNSTFLKKLWNYVITVTSPESNALLIQLISKGIPPNEWRLILPHLAFFCALFNYLLPTNDDFEFYDETNVTQKKFSSMPFSLNELRSMVVILRDVSLGLIELAYRDSKLSNDYRNAIQQEHNNLALDAASSSTSKIEELLIEERVRHWSNLFKCVVGLLRQLHNRDSRHQFIDENNWISSNVNIPNDKALSFKIEEVQLQRFEKFVGFRKMSKKQLEELGPLMSTTDIKNITILKEIPFVIPFTDRVKILQKLIEKDKQSNYGDSHHFMIPGSTIDIAIRRNYLYEDAFEKLSLENEPDIKKQIRVVLKNSVNMDEAGIDGGGLFREFLLELLKTSFDLNRGFFKSTTDRTLYPNPSAELVIDNYLTHFFFIGRIFGKAIYENILVELPFSHFFLAKLLTRNQVSDIDIHFLSSLDPIMYKNLLYLKNYEGDISELGLDFTVVQSEVGENRIIELKPNGSEIPVDVHNRIEYIHLMADYVLNKQIRSHVNAFKQGLANCIDLDWIRMFSARELQILVNGASAPIDLEDLKAFTSYTGGYTPDHLTVQNFWRAVESFTETQKSQLLRFVTSCSKPPLLGFSRLHPSFTIQRAGKAEDRLPTASTCMNLLKLPEFSDWQILRDKLLYAIESNSGFELS